jgi:predicted DNA-binding protein
MVGVGLYLSEVQVRRMKALSKKKGLTVSEMIRRMIDEGLEKKVKM